MNAEATRRRTLQTAASENGNPLDIPSGNVDEYLRVEVIRPAELLSQTYQTDLDNINNLINNAFQANGHPIRAGETGPVYAEMRISSRDQLVHELGPEGLLAICTDSRILRTSSERCSPEEGYYPGKYGQIVAVGAVSPWKGKTVALFVRAQQASAAQSQTIDANVTTSELTADVADHLTQAERDEYAQTWNWEVKACASVNDPTYRGQGLVTRCVDALVTDILSQREKFKTAGDPRGDLPVKLWSTTLHGSGNTEYWMRRGFVREGELDVAPKGLWTSLREFKLQTLSKWIG